MLSFSSSLYSLGNMDVHLITVKISVERCTDAFIKSKSSSRSYFYLESHHTNSVKTRLSVKDNDISVSQVSLDHISHSQLNFSFGCMDSQLLAIFCDDEVGSSSFWTPFLDTLFEKVNWILIDSFPDGEYLSHVFRDYDLIWSNIGVWRNNSSGSIIWPFSW